MNIQYLLVNFLLTFTTALTTGISLQKSALFGLTSLFGALLKLMPVPASALSIDNEARISTLEDAPKK